MDQRDLPPLLVARLPEATTALTIFGLPFAPEDWREDAVDFLSVDTLGASAEGGRVAAPTPSRFATAATAKGPAPILALGATAEI
jgi:hypothetical protein